MLNKIRPLDTSYIDLYEFDTSYTELHKLVTTKLISKVNQFRRLQNVDGSVHSEIDVAYQLLDEIEVIVLTIYLRMNSFQLMKAIETDLKEWRSNGLSTCPSFINSQIAYVPPNDKEYTFFIAPFLCANGPAPRGYFLECFFAIREEPNECKDLSIQFPHPKNICQSARFIAGSDGVSTGNCIVFFPENIAAVEKVNSQNFALFFFNKFQYIYLLQTIPKASKILRKEKFLSESLTPHDFYTARCIWGYLHDYFHHSGSRPFDTNLQVKLNWFAGLLEEIKVDCLTIITADEHNICFGKEIIEFILFERIFRYPSQPDFSTNFDAGTGVYLFEWLLLHEAIIIDKSSNSISLNLTDCIQAAKLLVSQIESIEDIKEDEAYLLAAKALVRELLPEGKDKKKFSLTKSYEYMASLISEDQLLSFHHLSY